MDRNSADQFRTDCPPEDYMPIRLVLIEGKMVHVYLCRWCACETYHHPRTTHTEEALGG